jgi:hypothetical protein
MSAGCPLCEHPAPLHDDAGCIVRHCQCWLRGDQVMKTLPFGEHAAAG